MGEAVVAARDVLNFKIVPFLTSPEEAGLKGKSLFGFVKGCYKASEQKAKKRLAVGEGGHIECVQLAK